MSKQKNHIPGLAEALQEYTESRKLDFHQYSPYHLRIMDGGFVVLDVWTTGRYYIMMTDYNELTDGNVIERGGEKGQLPITKIEEFIDQIFYPNNV
jgi:hypothetical protein